ncbi:MAG: hypothetical protein PVI86_16585, partial [Phycisphaerae bacterium]
MIRRTDRHPDHRPARFWVRPVVCLAASAVCTLLPSPPALAAPPPNDECEDAIAIAGQGIFAFDNTSATTRYPGSYGIHNDVWYCWTSSCSGAVTVDTCASTVVDTALGVWDGCDCPSGAPGDFLGQYPDDNDDQCAFQSRTTFHAQLEHNYLIQIGTALELTPVRIFGGTGTFTVACGDTPVPPCQEPEENCQPRDAWDAWTSDRTEYFVADDFTPAVSGEVTGICWWGIYLGEENALPPPDAFEVAYYVDEDGLPGAPVALFSQSAGTLTVEGPTRTYQLLADTDIEYEYKATHAPVPVSAGQCYWVEITNSLTGSRSWLWEVASTGNGRAVQDGRTHAPADGYDERDARPADLAFCLDVPLGDPQACRPIPENDACADSLSISEGETFFDTTGASTDGPDHRCLPSAECCIFPLGDHQVHRDVWFHYVAPCSARLTAELCDSPFDTKVAIYEG